MTHAEAQRLAKAVSIHSEQWSGMPVLEDGGDPADGWAVVASSADENGNEVKVFLNELVFDAAALIRAIGFDTFNIPDGEPVGHGWKVFERNQAAKEKGKQADAQRKNETERVLRRVTGN